MDAAAPSTSFAGPTTIPVLLAICTAIQYLCVPETDHYLNVVLTATGLGIIELLTAATYTESRFVVGALVAWAGWFGAAGRASAEIGAVASFWPLLVGVYVLWTRRARADSPQLLVVIVGIAAAASASIARTGGLADNAAPAVRSVALLLPTSAAIIAVVLAVVGTAERRASPGSPRDGSLDHS